MSVASTIAAGRALLERLRIRLLRADLQLKAPGRRRGCAACERPRRVRSSTLSFGCLCGRRGRGRVPRRRWQAGRSDGRGLRCRWQAGVYDNLVSFVYIFRLLTLIPYNENH